MPTPNAGESKEHFMSRCVSVVVHEEGDRNIPHAVAKCYGIYRQWQKEKGETDE